MPEAVLTPEQWDAVKLTNIKGVGDNELSEQFGITCEAIRQRRFRDPVWKAAIEAKGGTCNEVSRKGAETAFLAQKVASTISESSQALSDSNLLLASRIAQKGLKRADREIDLVPVENIADIERIVKIAAIAGKWNRPEVSVNQSFAFGGGQDDGAIVECETEIVEDSGQYGDSFGVDENEG